MTSQAHTAAAVRNAAIATAAVRARTSALPKWTCAQCGVQRDGTVHQRRQKYCSNACVGEAYKTRMRGAGNPHFSSAGRKSCAHCAATFYRYDPSAKFCSRECALDADALLTRRRNKRDRNQVEIVEAFRKLGWSVLDLADVGRGMPDLVIGDKSHGTFLVEVKNPATYYGRKGLSRSQTRFAEKWGGLVHVVKTLDDVIALTRTLAGGDSADGGGLHVRVIESVNEAVRL